MTHESIDSSIERKRAAQRNRFAAGQHMATLLRGRTLGEIEAIGVDQDKLADTRRKVWVAENKAVRLDPLGIYEPDDLYESRLEK